MTNFGNAFGFLNEHLDLKRIFKLLSNILYLELIV